MPPQIQQSMLAGKEGVDYHFVRYGDRVYVVYRVQIEPGKWVNTSWRVDKSDYDALGVNPAKVKRISKAGFKALNVFGSASEISGLDADTHPFQQYIRKLKELHGNVSWLDNKQFMSVMLMGFAENWSAEELRQRLTQTKWYQNRTDFQRTWELETTEADREAQTNTWKERMMEAVRELYGPAMNPEEAGFDMKAFQKQVERIASGKLGDPQDGFASWLADARRAAEKIEGTTAWIDRQQQLEEQRGFMNRPEDVFEQIRQDAMEWLGPKGIPDKQTLMGWAQDLVSEKRSDGDWQKFLRKQATSLYPWLGPDEKWMDRAGTYKNIMEDELGRAIGWDNKYLYQLGQTDADGKPTGAVLSYDDFARTIRQTDEWWGGSKANEEGFNLYNYLNETFNGVAV